MSVQKLDESCLAVVKAELLVGMRVLFLSEG